MQAELPWCTGDWGSPCSRVAIEIPSSPEPTGGRRCLRRRRLGAGGEPGGRGRLAAHAPKQPSSVVTTSPGQGHRTPQAYFFSTDSNLEYLRIDGPQVLGERAVNANAPFWHRVKAEVTLSVAGLILTKEGVNLGDPGFTQLSFEERPGQVFIEPPKTCDVTHVGVDCAGIGNAAVQFDFCREARCPAWIDLEKSGSILARASLILLFLMMR